MFLILILTTYLLGSFLGAVVLKPVLKLPDLSTVGSKNLGATNAFRATSSWHKGLAVLLFDATKGLIAAWLATKYLTTYDANYVMLACIIGHILPITKFNQNKFMVFFATCIACFIFLKAVNLYTSFHPGNFVVILAISSLLIDSKQIGGKGVATFMGGFIYLAPKLAITAIAINLIYIVVLHLLKFKNRFVGLIGVLACNILYFYFAATLTYSYYCIFGLIMITLAHKQNFKNQFKP